VALILPSDVLAQIIINEVSPASSPEWVEIYNISSSSASLKDYSINFGSETQNKFFCDTEVINGNAFKLIILPVTTHWLSDTGDVVSLRNGDDVADSVGYGTGYSSFKPKSTESITRSPDGSTIWILTTQPTQQGDIVSFDCPTPTPAPTPAPTPFPTPLPVVEIPTPIPTPKPTASPKVSSPTPGSLVEENFEATDGAGVLGMFDEKGSVSAAKKDNDRFPLIALGLTALGVLFIGLSIFVFSKTVKKSYTNRNENSNPQTS
jgi:hypothetical protein